MSTMPDEDNCLIQTKDGPIFGLIEKIDDGVTYKFKGIPYAKPPVGCLRFLVSLNIINIFFLSNERKKWLMQLKACYARFFAQSLTINYLL